MYLTKKQKKNSAAIPLKKNCRIFLKKGKGSKRKYNGKEASVVEYPSRGGWMTVATLTGSALKWRKGQYIVKPQYFLEPPKEQNTTHRINDDIWCTIFSFLVQPSQKKYTSPDIMHRRAYIYHNITGKGEGIWVKDAKLLHSKLTRVCNRWSNVCNNNMTMVFGHINANMDALPINQVVPHMNWMIKHNISIGSLVFHADYDDIPFLVKLLNTCKTSRLTILKARCTTSYSIGRLSLSGNFRSEWICSAYTSKIEGGIVDLTDPNDSVSLRDMCRVLGVPFSGSRPKLRHLHDVIASNCTNLRELLVNIEVPSQTNELDLRDHLSENLFSPNLKCKLHLRLSSCSGSRSAVLKIVLENLVNVEELSIGFSSEGERSYGPRKIRVASNYVRSLDVSGLGKNNYISGDLPNLKILICDCSFWGGGIIPQFNNVDEEQRCKDQIASHCRFHAGQVRIHDLNIPPACEIVTDSLGSADWQLQQFIDAPLC